MTDFFEDTDRWRGGFYELSFNLSDDRDDTVKEFLSKLWESPNLLGPFSKKDMAPDQQNPINGPDITIDGHMFGIHTFAAGEKCECGTYASNFQEEGQWVSLYFPMGALSRIFEVGGYPFLGEDDPSPEVWIKPLSEHLRGVAEQIFQVAPFDLAILGFESDYGVVRDQILSGTIADERWEGVLISSDHSLIWHPPTVWR